MNLLAVLFPRVRAEVLQLLFADASAELHLRELTRRSGLALGTVQTELAKLTAAQLVVGERDGNRRYYRANAAHPLFPVLQQLVHQTTEGSAGRPIAALLPGRATPSTGHQQSDTVDRPPATAPLRSSRNPEPETLNRQAQPATLTLNEID